MEEKVIQELKGHSGSKIFLMEKNNNVFVRKIGNVERNYERLTALYQDGYNVPFIYEKTGEVLDMEYIHGLDMKSYLLSGSVSNLTDFILNNLNRLSSNTVDKDYTEIYEKKLEWIHKEEGLPFTKKQLIDRLPKVLPSSNYHGDMTLENILHTDSCFYFIDPVTIEYDSYIFDIAKLRQDLECKWFLRHTKLMLDVKLNYIQERLKQYFKFVDDDNLLILMLLRVFLHTKPGDFNRQFILKEIHRLWK